MNKEELAIAVASKTGITKKLAETVVDAVMDTVADVVRMAISHDCRLRNFCPGGTSGTQRPESEDRSDD